MISIRGKQWDLYTCILWMEWGNDGGHGMFKNASSHLNWNLKAMRWLARWRRQGDGKCCICQDGKQNGEYEELTTASKVKVQIPWRAACVPLWVGDTVMGQGPDHQGPCKLH